MKITAGARIELTRRNLEVLLRKLDYNAKLREVEAMGDDTPSASGDYSACTIVLTGSETVVTVAAVENEEHYSDRDPGPMLDNESGELV